ncbi:MAG: PPC domain-containing protein [Gammaproteobacteria bacterium]|nr:PPC domain-containing protein [Gammaproteobacteria bacterium]
MKSPLLFISLFLLSTPLFATDDIAPLEPEETINNQIEGDSWQYYRIELDEPANLTVKLRKVHGDADMYVVSSRKPTTDFHECAPKKAGNRGETCRIKTNSSKIWYVGVHGKEQSSYDLKIESQGFTGKVSNDQRLLGAN